MAQDLTLGVKLTGDGSQLSGTLKDARNDVREFGTTTEREGDRSERSLSDFGSTAQKEGSKAARALRSTGTEVSSVSNHLGSMQRIATAALTTLVGFVGIRGISNEWSEIRRESELLERNLFRQQQLIETTGRTAERSAQQMLEQSRALALGTLQSTEGVMQAQQTLMTFRNIRGEVFDQAIEGALDLASAMGTDLNSTILQVAKALEDPVTGMTALTRSGTVFTAAQRDMVRGMVETNRTADAQAFILSELAAQYGGVAKAEAAGLAGAQDTIGQAMQEARLAIGEYLRVGERLSDFYNNTATTIFQFNDALSSGDLDGHIRLMTTTATIVGAAAGAYAAYRSILVAATVAQWAFNTAVRANPLGIAITLLGAAAGALYTYREEVTLAGKESFQTSIDVDGLTSSFHLLTEAQQENKRASLTADLIEMRVEAGRLGSELVEVSRKVRNSGQLTPEGGALPVATPEDIQKGRELRQELGMLLSDIDNGSQLLSEYDQAMAALGETTRDTDTRTRTLAETNAAASKAADELAKSTEAQADALEDLYDRLIPGRRETVQLARDIQTLNLAIAMGTGNIGQNIQAMGLLQQQFIEAQNDTDDLAKKTVDAAFTMEGAWDEVRLNGLRRLDDGFADLWEGAIDGSLNAGKLMKKALAQTLSEMGHMAVTRPITVQFATSMGFGGTGAGGQQDGGLDLSSMSSLKNGWSALKGGVSNIAWTGAGSSYGGTGWANAATQGTGATGFMGGSTANFSGMQGLASAGAGFAGSYAGRSVFGEGRDNATLETAGALVGTYFGGPLGAAAGSFIGSALASLDKETKFSGRFGTTSTNDPSQYSRSGKDGVFEHQDDGTQFYGQSALGYTGFLDRGTERLQRAGVGEDKGWAEELAQGAVARDNLVASLARSTKEIEVMQAAVQGLESSSSNAGELIEFALNERPRAALEALEGTFGEFVRNLEGGIEQVVEQAQFAQAAHGVLSQGMARLNLQFDAASAGSFEAASNLAQLAGGVENLAAIQQGYYEATYSETERLSRSQAELRASLAGVTDQVPNTVGELRAMVEAQNLNDAAAGELAVRLMELAPALKQTNDAVRDAIEQQYQESLGRAPDASGMDYWFNQVATGGATLERALSAIAASSEAAAFAADGAAGSVDSLADALREREQLERQLLTLEGNTAELRRRDLEATDESNRALQRRIWAVQDEQERLRNLDRQQQERVRTISQEASAMARARDQLASFGVTITSYIDNLRGTDAGLASPADQLAASSQAFYEQYDKAAAGDRDAMNSITQYADRFIEAQKGWSASGSQTTATIDKVAGMLEQLPEKLSAEQFLANEFRDIIGGQTSQLGVMLDLNRDGVVSAIEQSITASWSGVEALKTTLYQEMQQLGAQSLTEQQVRSVLAPHATDAEINRLIQRVDHNGDGIISQEEITGSRIAGLSTGIVSALASNFSSIDVNASGLIDYDEFSQAFSGMATDSTLEKLFNLIDTNGDGQISYLESIAASSLTLAELGLGRQPGDTDDVLGGNPSAIDNIINKNPVSDPIASKVDAAYHDVMGTAAKGFQVTSWANWLSQKDTRAGQLHQAVAWANLPLGGEEWLKERGLFAAGMPEFYAGGWTGPGGKYDEAGIVHAEEFVVRSEVVKQPGVREMLEKLNRGASAYASDFRPPVVSKPASMPKRAPFPQSPPLLDFSDVLQELRDIKRELKQAHEEKKRLMKTIAKRTGEAGQAATESALRAEQQRGQQVEELQALNRAGKTRGRTV
ncbi:EF-hand domain-containing protein [Halomonas profundus]|nr:EF-hand domain-containing protein [Halomonas profundus]